MKSLIPVKKIVAGVGAGAALTTGTAFYIAYRIIHPKRKSQDLTPKDFDLDNYKKIEFRSKDGTLLRGWLILAKEPRGLVVLSHGYSFDKQSMLPGAKELFKNNYSCLLFDYRAHGESKGDKTTIGVLEQEDLLAACEFAGRFSDKIGVVGVSMGAATAIMVASKIKGLKAIVADSSYQKLKDIIYRKSPVLIGMIINFMKIMGADVERSEPINYVDGVGVPIFFIHGDKDDLVPSDDSVKLFEKAKNPKELWIVKNGLHGRSYFVDRNEYLKKVIEFLNKYMT